MNTEIMIGNIVGTYEPHRVNGIYLSHFTAVNKNGVEHNSVQYNLSPIPLTPEILEKAGFTVDCVHIHDYKGYGFKTTQIDYIVGDWADEFRSFEITSTEFDKGIVYNHKCRANIKHLHQLQNLYFALTGEELKIEL